MGLPLSLRSQGLTVSLFNSCTMMVKWVITFAPVSEIESSWPLWICELKNSRSHRVIPCAEISSVPVFWVLRTGRHWNTCSLITQAPWLSPNLNSKSPISHGFDLIKPSTSIVTWIEAHIKLATKIKQKPSVTLELQTSSLRTPRLRRRRRKKKRRRRWRRTMFLCRISLIFSPSWVGTAFLHFNFLLPSSPSQRITSSTTTNCLPQQDWNFRCYLLHANFRSYFIMRLEMSQQFTYNPGGGTTPHQSGAPTNPWANPQPSAPSTQQSSSQNPWTNPPATVGPSSTSHHCVYQPVSTCAANPTQQPAAPNPWTNPPAATPSGSFSFNQSYRLSIIHLSLLM